MRDIAPAEDEGGIGRSELRIVSASGGPERVLARTGGRCGGGLRLAGLSWPQFMADRSRIAFESASTVVSGTIHVVSIAGARCHYVAPGNSVEVLRDGKYRDHLVVSQHRYFLAGGSYDWYWLLTAEGREIGPIGDDEDAVQTFREESGVAAATGSR